MPMSLKNLVDHAMQVEEHAEQLATGLAEQGASEAAEVFTQCAKAARQVVKQLPAAPGNQPEEGSEEPATPEGEVPPEAAAAQAEEAPASSSRPRTPYGEPAAEMQRGMQRKRGR